MDDFIVNVNESLRKGETVIFSANCSINYSGRAELVDTFNRMLKEFGRNGRRKTINEDLLSQFLYTSGMPDPDLLIRTSGEMRSSNFLIWQSAYSEYYFTPVLWPDFNEEEVERALQTYKQRQRRFGGLQSEAACSGKES